MTTVDLSALQDFLPLLVFLLVFTVVFAILAKTKILGESKFVNLLVSFIVSIVFVSMTSARAYVIQITPWFAIFAVVLMFVLVIAGFHGKVPGGLTKGLGVVAVIGLLIVFLISAFYTFSSEPFISKFGDWVTKPRVYGALLLLVVSAIASWVLTRK